MSYRRADLVTVQCNGRAVAGRLPRAVGEVCGKPFTAGRDLVEARARAAGWKFGPVRPDGSRDVICPDCGRPDPATARLCRELDRWLR